MKKIAVILLMLTLSGCHNYGTPDDIIACEGTEIIINGLTWSTRSKVFQTDVKPVWLEGQWTCNESGGVLWRK